MSYGIISAWKSASEYEQVEHFLEATLRVDDLYLNKNCSNDIEFVDVSRNKTLIGKDQLISHLKNRWSSIEKSFVIEDLNVAFADTSEVASFKLTCGKQEVLGLILIEVSNGKISLCRFAIGNV